MFVAVGSASNIDDTDARPEEFHRADILEYTPEGKFVGVYASGIRNPVGLAVNRATGEHGVRRTSGMDWATIWRRTTSRMFSPAVFMGGPGITPAAIRTRGWMESILS